jgi:hypothetical protein
MSGGPKRNEDRLNTIGVVVVGICGAVMVYVTIVALEAFYMNDTSELQTMADYGGQDTTARSHKADEMRNITEPGRNGIAEGIPQTYRIKIDHAMDLIVRDAANDPTHLVPSYKPSDHPTVKPMFGKGQPLVTPAPPSATPGAAGSGAGSAAAANPAPVRATPAGAPDTNPNTPAGGHAP